MNAADVEIHSIPELRKYIKKADLILGMLHFGVVEKRIKVSKKEALYLIEDLEDSETAEDLGIYGSNFGSIEIDDKTGKMTLYLG